MHYLVINGWDCPAADALGVLVDYEVSFQRAVATARRFQRDISAQGGGTMPIVIASRTDERDWVEGTVVRDGRTTKRLWSNQPDHFDADQHQRPIEHVNI